MNGDDIQKELIERTGIESGTVGIVFDSIINEIENTLLMGDFVWVLKFGRIWLKRWNRTLYNCTKGKHQTIHKQEIFIKCTKEIKLGVRNFK